MKKIILIFSLLLSFLDVKSQNNIQKFKPVDFYEPDLSIKTQTEIKKLVELLNNETPTLIEQKELDILVDKYGESVKSAWDVVGMECSWYCGGGNYKVRASSELKSQNKNSYKAKSANDLSYETAWVEGKNDDGIGEFIEFLFENKSPRITSIIISNGYVKTEKTWKDNNRVKSLKLYVNNKVYGILELTDSRADQIFKIGTFGHNKDGSELILKFEVLEVYKGQKFNDTAITEIYFDGIDVH